MNGSTSGSPTHNGAILAAPGVLPLLGSSIAARLPLAMFSIALLVHVRSLTGSFASAGLAAGAYAAAEGLGGPALGRLVDRRGQRVVLVLSAAGACAALCVVAALPRGVPVSVLVALAAAIGLATPPVGACVRGVLPRLLQGDALRAAYAYESSALELTFIFGPPIALGLGAAWSTGAALACGGVVLLAATALFAAQPASRAFKPEPRSGHATSLVSPGLRTLVLVLAALGVVFGAVEVGVTAAAARLGGPAVAGLLLAVWGVGSLVGGIAASRVGGGARSARGLAVILAALAAGHAAIGGGVRHPFALGVLLFLAGASIAPAYASVYARVDQLVPQGTVTEAFAWLATAISVGAAGGSALAGVLVDGLGVRSVFVLAGTAGASAVVLVVIRGRSLVQPTASLVTAQPALESTT